MKIDVFNIKEFIDLNQLSKITSPILFQRGDVPDPYGLISNEIFGVDIRSRKLNFAFIDLHGHFFNPHIYKAFKRLWRNIEKVINGDYFYNIDSTGYIYQDNENGRTGIENIYKDWDKINWEKSVDTSSMRNERIDLLTKTKKNVIFMDYQIVIPAFYRDVNLSGKGGGETPVINDSYAKLIRLASLLENRDMFDFTIHSTYYNMQNIIVEIYDYFKLKLEKKGGMLRKFLLGKNTDYCTRSVISAPIYHAEHPDKMETDFMHSGIPISQICSLCYPLMMAFIKNWFENEFIHNKETKLMYNSKSNETVTLKNPESYFTDEFIKKMMDRYIRDPEYRFTPIKVPLSNGKFGFIHHTGTVYDSTNSSEVSSVFDRPMTVTDLLYIAAYDVTKDKHAFSTRYPVSDSYGVFFTQVRVISTMITEVVKIGQTIYDYYPKVELNLSEAEIATRFKETTIFSSSFLEGIGGDYDGDQITNKILWSQEANAEIAKAMMNPAYFIKATGTNIRQIGQEGLQTFYILTKEPKDKTRIVPVSEVERFVKTPTSDYTFTFLMDTFAKKRDGDKVGEAKYKTTDIVKLKAGQYFNKEEITTTLGRLFYNKIIVEACGLKDVLGYVNKVLIKGAMFGIEDQISSSIADGTFPSMNMVKYIDHRDWLGYQGHAVVGASFTEKTLRVPPEIKARKKELLTKYKKEIEEGNVQVSEMIEKELTKMMEKYLDGDVGYDLFLSGSKLSSSNNLKNITLMKGAVMNPNTGSYEVITNSLMGGMEKDKFTAYSNSNVIGSYYKAVGTADSGYLAKQLSASMQTEVIDEDGSDCGTNKTLLVYIDSSNKKLVLGRNIRVGDLVITLTNANIDKYLNKFVKMFSPMYCIGDKICRKCAGTYGNRFVGLDANKIATTLTNLNMKKFHDATIKTLQLNPEELLLINKKKSVFTSNWKEIINTDKYMEFYIPEYFFDESNKFAIDTGDKINILGLFNVGIFTNGKLDYIDTMMVPSQIDINVYESESRTIFLPGTGSTPCRVVKYYQNNVVCKSFMIKDSTNAQTFLRCIIYGKLPSSIPYSKAHEIWKKNQTMNNVNFGIVNLIEEVVLRVMYRDKNNMANTFSKVIGQPNSKVSEYDYMMASVRQVCQYASTFSGITFEDFDSMVTTSINREREKKKETDSPLEAIFKM